MSITFEKQIEGNLADPVWGVFTRIRPFQFVISFGLYSIIVENK